MIKKPLLMKKVRFDVCVGSKQIDMDEPECHSPRPFMGKILEDPIIFKKCDVLDFLDRNNSSPYLFVDKSEIHKQSFMESGFAPTEELDISTLEISNAEPRQVFQSTGLRGPTLGATENKLKSECLNTQSEVSSRLTSNDNISVKIPRPSSFFFNRENKMFLTDFTQKKLDDQNKENRPIITGTGGLKNYSKPVTSRCIDKNGQSSNYNICSKCDCSPPIAHKQYHETCNKFLRPNISHYTHKKVDECPCYVKYCKNCFHEPNDNKIMFCQNPTQCVMTLPVAQDAVNKKAMEIEIYEQRNKKPLHEETTLDVSSNIKEPTVSDLFKIIKLQNEQLQLLQEKVDKFICTNTMQSAQPQQPVNKCITERVSVETVDDEHHRKISIGVMTSFEMYHSSRVVNTDVIKVKSKTQSAQIQCNRSQLSVKEINLRSPIQENFLDGIVHVDKENRVNVNENCSVSNIRAKNYYTKCTDIAPEEKTLNELSLYNVQVDNATTPLISPEQTMYLDVKDYSDSDSGSDHSNVGWTYYNKVMTHVNGMLQDSDMPSSASALYRQAKEKCVQMKIDKTNISVTKRVKFGCDVQSRTHIVESIHQHVKPANSTDTSMKMNQLAAKYLNNSPFNVRQNVKPPLPTDMSLATKNYMERHQLLQGIQNTPSTSTKMDIPKFLDVTALKNQPKLL